MIRFHLDEHVDHAIAHALRGRGVDVTTTTDAALLGATDEEHLDLAKSENRVVFTNDADFLALATQRQDHSGIGYCAVASRSVGYVVRYLCLMNDCLESDELKGKIEYV